MSYTTDPNDPRIGKGPDAEPVPQHDTYLILSDEERAKGFVRPVRRDYVHVGRKLESQGELLPLADGLGGMSEAAQEMYTEEKGYGGYLKYPEGRGAIGRFLTIAECEDIRKKKENSGGCGVRTTMSFAIAETYARDPKFYGYTYCCGCNKHLPVEEFVWDGTNERVGS